MENRRLSGKRKLSDDEGTTRKHQNTGLNYKAPNSARQDQPGPSKQTNQEDAMEIDDNDDIFLEDEGDTYIDGIRIPAPRDTETCLSNKESRIIVTKIVTRFFKSYAEEQVLGPFDKCFNAIIGPNGSGKSNVIDSVLFVFGFRANRIRSKNIKVLIHHSEKYPNVQSCTVEVHFVEIIDKGGESYEIIPNSEFVISRSAFSDNSSCYEINGKRVQFKEVALLLKRHGIDLQYSRFLILQGEVEQIALMKPKGEKEGEIGLLEYMEDIIGTNRYKKPLDQLKEREELVASQRSKQLNRLRITQNQLDALKEPMEEAVKFLQIENNIARLKNSIYQKNIFDLEKQVNECGKEREEFATIADELNEQLKAISKEKSEKEKILNQKSKEYENLKKSNAKLKEAFDKASNKDVQLLANMTQINQNRKKYKEQLVTEKKKLSKLEQVPEDSEKGIEECETKQQELFLKQEKLNEEKVKLLSEVRVETRKLTEKKEVLETELIQLKTVVDETKSKFTLAESQLKILTSNEDQEKDKYEHLKTTLNDINKLIDQRSTELNQLKQEIPEKQNLLKLANNKLNKIRQDENQILNEFRTKRSSLEEKKSAMQASNTRGRVLNVLMQQKREGNCPGLYGRLGDLGGIDQKYDIAISTACGQLDFLVTDTVDTAQWCIDYLKRNDIGRATFIALEKQEHLRSTCNKKIQTPENVHRLFDLIQVNDETVKTAFYYALRDTLVANDINQATRVAYGQQRYRVVTLKGEIIEMTGTMSGGGKQVSRGRMGKAATVVNINPKEIQELELNINKSEEELKKLREVQRNLEEEIENYETELEEMNTDFKKFSVELQSLEKQQPALLNQLKEQENKVKLTKTNPAKVKELTKIVTDSKVSYDKALEKAGSLQVNVDKLTKEIDDKIAHKMKGVEKNIAETAKVLTNCKNEITRLTVAIKTSKKNIEKSQEKVKVLEQDIEKAENQLKDMKAERDQTEEDAKNLLTAIDEIASKLVDEEEKFAEIKQEVTNLKKQESKVTTTKIENGDKLKTIDEKLSDFNTTIHQFHAKLKSLKLQEVPNETVEELQKFTTDELEKINSAHIERELKVMQENLKTTKPNLPVIEEYYKTQTIFLQRSKDFEEINKQHTTIRQAYDNLRNQRKIEFLKGYNVIRLKVKEVYQMITIGGDADFDLIDSFDPFAEGIQFNVRPPRKCWKNLSNLSGGEKTLSSLALVFALHYYKPSPIYVMDEIDAALDFKNVSIIAHYIKERTKNTQFIIISLRSSMYEMGDLLVGIYKTYGCTKTVVLNPKLYDKPHQDENVDNNVQ